MSLNQRLSLCLSFYVLASKSLLLLSLTLSLSLFLPLYRSLSLYSVLALFVNITVCNSLTLFSLCHRLVNGYVVGWRVCIGLYLCI